MSEATTAKGAQGLRQLVDFGALIAFMATYFITKDMIKATWVLVIASGIALAVGFVLEKRLAPMPLITGGFALIFGVLTIVTDDDLFVKLKLTIQNGLLAAVLLGSLPLKKYPFKALLGSTLKITDVAWRKLTLRYGLYFLCVAIANEVFRNPDIVNALWSAMGRGTPDANGVWTSFRGVLWIAASVFGLSQVPLIMKNMIKEDEDIPLPETPDTGL